jgi:hypothetical protein
MKKLTLILLFILALAVSAQTQTESQPKNPAWTATTVYVTNAITRQAIGGAVVTLRSNSLRTSGGTFDATEATNWTYVSQESIQPFAASTFYPANQQIYQLDKIWQRVTAGTSGAAFDATEQLQWSSLGGAVPVISTVATVNNNAVANTLAPVTGLSCPLAVGTYVVNVYVPFTTAIATTGSRWTLNFSGTATTNYRSTYTATAVSETVNSGLNAFNLPAASNGSAVVASNTAQISGQVVVTVAGNLTVQFASEIASSAITAQSGGWIECRKIQ